ncbi:ABC transporter ATP-binding protein [Clostridium luticellarii]|uniref:ABC transporter ATP-binding protein n=1 Tax=Clostridium luticellarii TaxID=1691940 RepID=UPI0023521426|nr:ABC transporter ATP-binding protein [Clostridium luticellarii]MCI1944041.1 ABC transporter ATP-binding protein [Clostridium luticellarii]MCI1967317.1 ABC transporter ATP-binding protein [Clostridium luticellarii]
MHSQMNFCPNSGDEIMVELENVCKKFEDRTVLQDITLYLKRGEFVSILGPSGCGKSTLFNIITGFVKEDSGRLFVRDDIGYMQQKDLLLPWKTVLSNVVLPLDIKGRDKKQSRRDAKKYIDMFGLDGYENKYPYELSGGMKQRASFLRTFLCSKEIMLLDEPFGALDSITRGKMQNWILDMKEKLHRSILFVTHDIEEAIVLSDRIYVLSSKPGRVKEEIAVDFSRDNKGNRLFSQELLKMKSDILKLL